MTKHQLNWPTIILMTVLHVLALIAIPMFNWQAFTVAAILYFFTALGITLGFHRYFTHHSFKTNRVVRNILAVMGTLALQGNIFTWVGHHRMHHAHSDTGKDPHDGSRGFWWCHLLWMMWTRPEFDDPKLLKKFTRDLQNDRFLRLFGTDLRMIALQVLLGVILLVVGDWSWVFWGIFVRAVALYHATWFVNSACHMWGYKNYTMPNPDRATNLWWVAIIALGEGWHHNHHAYGDAAYHGHKWWEFDITGIVIRLLKITGLAWDIKPIPPEAVRPATPAPTPLADLNLA